MKWNECVKNIIKIFILNFAENRGVCLLGLKQENTKKDSATRGWSEKVIYISQTKILMHTLADEEYKSLSGCQ